MKAEGLVGLLDTTFSFASKLPFFGEDVDDDVSLMVCDVTKRDGTRPCLRCVRTCVAFGTLHNTCELDNRERLWQVFHGFTPLRIEV